MYLIGSMFERFHVFDRFHAFKEFHVFQRNINDKLKPKEVSQIRIQFNRGITSVMCGL